MIIAYYELDLSTTEKIFSKGCQIIAIVARITSVEQEVCLVE